MKGRARVLLIGGLSGALAGLVGGAWLYMRMARSKRPSPRSLCAPADLVRWGLSIVSVLRQIAALSRAMTS